jgi:hypothetical protein
VNWTAIENAIHSWVVASSQLSAANVIWAAQRGPIPTSQYILLRLADVKTVGRDWTDYESTVQVRGVRTLRLSMQAFNGAPLGSSSNMAILERVILLAANSDLLRDGGVGLGPIGTINIIDGNRSTLLEPRAVVDIEIHVASELVGTGTTIEHVEVLDQTSGRTIVIDRPSIDG